MEYFLPIYAILIFSFCFSVLFHTPFFINNSILFLSCLNPFGTPLKFFLAYAPFMKFCEFTTSYFNWKNNSLFFNRDGFFTFSITSNIKDLGLSIILFFHFCCFSYLG